MRDKLKYKDGEEEMKFDSKTFTREEIIEFLTNIVINSDNNEDIGRSLKKSLVTYRRYKEASKNEN